MAHRYELLLSPYQIGNKTLKNRLISSKFALQNFTMEQAVEFYGNTAKNGAATVTVAMGDHPEREFYEYSDGMGGTGNDMRDPAVVDGYQRIAEEIHKYSSLASASMMDIEPTDVNISDTPNWDDIPKNGDYNEGFFRNKPGISYDRLQTVINEFVFRAKEARDLGFDMCTFYMSYRSSLLALSMSPLLNQRTDRYGGSTMAERATLAKEIFGKIKAACGQDFLIEAQISAVEEAPGYTLEDFLDYCKELEGYVDIIQIRGVDGSDTHVNGLNCPKGHPLSIDYAAAFKKRGICIACAPVGGYGDPEMMEQFLREGKTDLFAMARKFLAEDRYFEKLQAGLPAEEFVPCILCNGCHGHHTCAVNPRSGRKKDLFAPETTPKKVAVVGSGAAGLVAALTAVQRGHRVTIYEKAQALGGQLIAAGVPDYKWPILEYLEYLKGQLRKTDVEVHLGTEATCAMLRSEGYDAVIAAVGSAPVRPPVKGAAKAWLAEDVFGREAELGKRVLVIGGADTGLEACLYLARNGHQVTVVTRGQINLSNDMHTIRLQKESYEKNPNFSYVDHAITEEIGDHHVRLRVQTNAIPNRQKRKQLEDEDCCYSSQHGSHPKRPEPQAPDPVYAQRILEFDDVVVSGGRQPRRDVAKALEMSAPIVKIVGDALLVDNIKRATYSGYKAAMEL